MEDVSIFEKADMALSKALLQLGKWIFFALLGVVGVFEVYFTFTDLLSDGWGLSSISKIELAFVVAFLFLSKRLVTAAISSGINIFRQLFRTMVFLGGLVILLVVWQYIEVLKALYAGVSTVEILSFIESVSYEDSLVSMVLLLLILYVSAPFEKNETPNNGSEDEAVDWEEVGERYQKESVS